MNILFLDQDHVSYLIVLPLQSPLVRDHESLSVTDGYDDNDKHLNFWLIFEFMWFSDITVRKTHGGSLFYTFAPRETVSAGFG